MSTKAKRAQRPLVDAMTADERRVFEDALARMEANIKEHRVFFEEHARHAASIEVERDRMIGTLPAKVRQQLAAAFGEYVPASADETLDGEPVSEMGRAAARQIRAAAEMGFFMAVLRYRDWLVGNREVAKILHGREIGHRKGHDTQSREREIRYQKIRDKRAELEAAGAPCTYDVIAKAIGCSRQTVDRAINGRPTTRPKR